MFHQGQLIHENQRGEVTKLSILLELTRKWHSYQYVIEKRMHHSPKNTLCDSASALACS